MNLQQRAQLQQVISIYRRFLTARNDFEKLQLLGAIEDFEERARVIGLSQQEIKEAVDASLKDITGDEQKITATNL
jgi:hypothetical protein